MPYKTLFHKPLLIVIAFLAITQLTNAQNTYYPEKNKWELRDPSSQKFDATKLERAVKFAHDNEYTGSRDLRIAIYESFKQEPYHELAGPTKKRGGPAGMIIKNGYIVAQWGDVERVDMTFSVTKSFLSSVAGLAIDAGLIENVNDKVQRYVWEGQFDSQHNSKITWHHLLTQSSDWSGDLFGMPDWGDRPPSTGGIDEWKNRKLIAPGTNYEYNDVRVNLLAHAMLQVWRKPLPQVLKDRIMDPIGASTTWRWYGYHNSSVMIDGIDMQSVSGGGHNGGGMFINTVDMAKFGYLYLRKGKWKGQQLISDKWIGMSVASSEANPSYGYLWWLNRGDRSWQGVDGSVYYAAGFGGNYIVIDQKNDLLIVTRWLEPSKLGEMVELVYDALK